MLVRGLVAESLGETGGSAFTKNCRPSSFRTLAICAFASFAKSEAKKIAQRASAVRISPAVFAVRLIIRLLALGKATTILEPTTQQTVFTIDGLSSMFLPY